MLSIARSRFALLVQFVFLIANAVALLLGVVYNHNTPELYANNAHGKIGWIITWIASAWALMALVQRYAERFQAHPFEEPASEPMTAANMARYQRAQDEQLPSPSRFSNDSGQGTERNSVSLFGHSRSPSVESENQQFTGPTRRYTRDEEDEFDAEAEKRGFLGNSAADRFLSRSIARLAVGRPLQLLQFLYAVVDRTILVQGFFAFASGTVVYGGIGVSKTCTLACECALTQPNSTEVPFSM
jgi:hypothetical protein